MRQQLVLNVPVQIVVLGDEIVMEINLPLHLLSMHGKDYAVKCMYRLGATPQVRACPHVTAKKVSHA